MPLTKLIQFKSIFKVSENPRAQFALFALDQSGWIEFDTRFENRLKGLHFSDVENCYQVLLSDIKRKSGTLPSSISKRVVDFKLLKWTKLETLSNRNKKFKFFSFSCF